ncbi:MAG TPA: NAD-dependent epimerase/dehydratase family protein [Pyrinomonadaceae bacterium]|nr:NAD-dependent epimerase/dehydratase family protein [Pyrinomonadaceae bacterium]
MKLLILGGTLFLGRHLVEAALARGHEVTIFNRGRRNPELFPEVEKLRGDRDGGLDALRGGSWDAVVDTSGYVPRLVRASAELLADKVGLYVFVSSVSAYADFSRPVHEDAPLAAAADETVEEVTGETYGPLKVLSERAAEAAMPGRVLVVRPGLIVGPHDPTVRFSYWTARVARGGEVLAPGNPARQIQIIDARDLAGWTVRMAEAGRAGVYNASGPDYTLTMGRFLEECRAASRSGARLTWVGEEFLLERGAEPWGELPLWIPESSETHGHFLRASVERAVAAGLTFRPLAETIRDTLAWQRENEGRPAPGKDGVPQPDVTLKPERERELLAEWHRRQ